MKTKALLLWAYSWVGEKDNKLVNKTDDRIMEYDKRSQGNKKDVALDIFKFRCSSPRKPLREMILKLRFEGWEEQTVGRSGKRVPKAERLTNARATRQKQTWHAPGIARKLVWSLRSEKGGGEWRIKSRRQAGAISSVLQGKIRG